MTSLPKPLHEVLEEEYVAMYGPLENKPQNEADVYKEIHKHGNRTALCISGGGIRSATFALGVIQGLASAGILKRFDYLSTVSGGGYIGSWLSSWIRRHPEGVAGVEGELQTTDTGVAQHEPYPAGPNVVRQTRPATTRKIDPEPEPVRHLRDYSNYLSPKLGILSGDSWTMASLYVRNLILNLLVIVPILAAVLATPRLFSWALAQRRELPDSAWVWLFAALTTAGFAYLGWTRPVERMKEKKKEGWFRTTDGWFMLLCIVPLTAAGVALSVFWARNQNAALLQETQTQRALLVALLGMTVVPAVIYYTRAFFSRGASFHRGSGLWKRVRAEAVAILGAVAATGGLFYLLAYKIFDDPIRATPQLAETAPLLRLGLDASPQAQLFVCFGVPAVLLVFFVQASIFVGLSGRRNEDYDREWWGRAGAWLLFFAVAIGVVCFISVFGPVALYQAPVILGSVGGVAGIAAALLGYSDKTAATQKKQEEGGKTAAAGNIASALVVPIFVVVLLAAISLATTTIIHIVATDDSPEVTKRRAVQAALQAEFTSPPVPVQAQDKQTYEQKTKLGAAPLLSMAALRSETHLIQVQQTTWAQLSWLIAIGLAGVGLSFFIGTNRFSMAALYRNRLIRAYLGASRTRRQPNSFTGFDPSDNLQMWQLRPEMLSNADIPDPDGFVDAVVNPDPRRKALADELVKHLDAAVIAKPIDATALVQNLNHILLCDDDLPGQPEWSKPFGRIFRNRAALDHHFGIWVRPMPLPSKIAAKVPAEKHDLPRRPSLPPLHVVNTCLNLTTGDDLAWQQRQAESMTVSPYHSGNIRLGYRPSQEYGGEDGISLGTAVGISGAAASPNMGYHSSPLMAFLLTFFNIRLGAWLGNPGKAGAKSYRKAHPVTNLKPMVKELTGSANDRSPWVYLSDGGHFENLGLYEMVLRRCHYIVLSDAGADPKFSFDDLGSAIRKIRTDFGIPIEFEDRMEMSARPSDGTLKPGRYIARATIRYSNVDGKEAKDGTLIYIKAGLYDEPTCPRDVYNYAQESAAFPHEPTSDQFFSESQFESYRALGRHAVNEMCGNYPLAAAAQRLPVAKTFDDVTAFVEVARKNTGPIATTKPV